MLAVLKKGLQVTPMNKYLYDKNIKKGVKGFGILYIVVIVLCLLLFVFNLLGGAKLAVDLIIIAVVAYFVYKKIIKKK